MFEIFRKNDKWLNNVRNKQFSWNKKYSHDNKTLQNIDIYNFEIKTHNIIDKLTMDDLPKTIPLIFLWSPYHDSPTKKSKGKMEIINGMNKELDNFTNVVYFYVEAPHQMERVLPITLSNIITKRKPKN